jgi:hypothetical protein
LLLLYFPSFEQPGITIEDPVNAAQNNDLDKLCRCIDEEIARNPEFYKRGRTSSTPALQIACQAAARYNHTAALRVLLDKGRGVDAGMTITQAYLGDAN